MYTCAQEYHSDEPMNQSQQQKQQMPGQGKMWKLAEILMVGRLMIPQKWVAPTLLPGARVGLGSP